jgi:hypothetical protein
MYCAPHLRWRPPWRKSALRDAEIIIIPTKNRTILNSLLAVHNFQIISAQGWSQTVTGVTVVIGPRIWGAGRGLGRIPRGAQVATGRVPERKRPRKVKEGAVCVLEKGRKKRKESKAHLKNVEPLWCP